MHCPAEEIQVISGHIGKEELAGICAVAACYGILGMMGIGCPILFVTGISCAGCGMTRAWLSLFRLDPASAFHYHPLFWLPALAVFFYLFKRKVFEKWFWAGVVLFFAVYGIRMVSGQSGIVVFRPADGFLYRVIAGI